ncbi:MAG: DUF4358 domain-containing protein [Lachnospiraceae bacterium]|nr:DUF4358 domain-containing protein [Lachnospiraceae bacterium]MDE7286916.1 DUF4358 domain-containing protein [Lachnospiraceae bacterium]
MKNKCFFAVIFCTLLFVTGCTDNYDKNQGSNAYVDEGNGQEDAINTLQIGSKYKIVGPMDDLKDAVVGILGENYWPDTLLSAEELAERTGVSENMYEDFMAEYQHTEAGIDMMILVKAKPGEIENVEHYLNEYREVLLKIYEQQPQNKAKVFASRIEIIDDYVCYIQLGANIALLENQGEEEMIAYCQQENERALDIIEKQILNS